MSNAFKIVVFLHVFSAVIWIGSAVVLELIERESARDEARSRLALALRRGKWFGSRVFGPAAIATLLTGIIAVAIGRPAFGDLWVIIALVSIVVTAVIGGGIVGRSMGKLEAMLADSSISTEEIVARLDRIKTLAYFNLALLIFILFDMVMRPTGPDPAFVSISGVYLAAVVILLAVRANRIRRVAAPAATGL